MKKKKIILIVTILILCVLLGGGIIMCFANNSIFKKVIKPFEKISVINKKENNNLIDDWVYEVPEDEEDYMLYESSSAGFSGTYDKAMVNSAVNLSTSDSTLGFAVGGAKNINNFRENIKNGYLPISTDLTYNGLFYDYYFDTGRNNEKENLANNNEMFYPTYSTAISKDPISGELEYYMTVGLNSNIKESDFQRKKLNVVVVMDISGSMSSSFNDYYYDQNYLENNKISDNRSKMVIANESLNCLIDELNPDDNLGIVLFDDESYLAKPINLIGETDVEKIKEHILEIVPQGGTNFEAGYSEGTKLFTEEMLQNDEYENRIIVITDAMPNLGETSKEGLTKYVKKNADDGIYTTFIGVGVDFNTDVIECLSDVRGANYYSVHNTDEFKKIMGEDFDYMVTPLVFDLELKFDSDLFEIEEVYGTDTKDKLSGTIMKVNTLFPSSSNDDGDVKGGVILLKLKSRLNSQLNLEKVKPVTKLKVSYKDRSGTVHENEQDIKYGNSNEEKYDNSGIRKAIALTRYANLMKNWILYERLNDDYASRNVNVDAMKEKSKEFLVSKENGIIDCTCCTIDDVYKILGEHERVSKKLVVSDEYKEVFDKFEEYLKKEITEIGDETMNQEIEILNLCN